MPRDRTAPTRRDYDTDPERFRTGARLSAAHGPPEGPHERIAAMLRDLGATRVLDVGCGEGALRMGDTAWVVGLDGSPTMLAAVAPPVVLGDAAALPFTGAAFDAVVAVNVYDHLPDPRPALLAAHRVLATGGVLVAGTISREDSPELAEIWRPAPTPFDAEDAPDIVAEVFARVEVHGWDAPMLTLPDRDAVADFLVARMVPPHRAATDAARVTTPVTLTKRGALVVGHKA